MGARRKGRRPSLFFCSPPERRTQKKIRPNLVLIRRGAAVERIINYIACRGRVSERREWRDWDGRRGLEQRRSAAHVPWSAERNGNSRIGGRTQPSLYHRRGGGGGGRGRGAAMAAAAAAAEEPMGVAEGKVAVALVPMDAARRRLGENKQSRALITSSGFQDRVGGEQVTAIRSD